MDCVKNDWLSLAMIDCLLSSLCQTRSRTEQEGQPVPRGVRGPTSCPQCTDRDPLLHWPRPVVCLSMSPASVSLQQVVNLDFTWICRFHVDSIWKILYSSECNTLHIYLQYALPFQPENRLKNVVRIYFAQPKNCLNSSHDFILIHIYRSKN